VDLTCRTLACTSMCGKELRLMGSEKSVLCVTVTFVHIRWCVSRRHTLTNGIHIAIVSARLERLLHPLLVAKCVFY